MNSFEAVFLRLYQDIGPRVYPGLPLSSLTQRSASRLLQDVVNVLDILDRKTWS